VRRHTVIALILSGVGIVGLILTFTTFGGVRGYIADRYTRVADERVPGDDDPTEVYASTDPVSETASDIAGAHKPADRRVTEAGVFLRDEDDIVSVVPRSAGTRILVDDEDTGYRRGFVYLGGWWGTYSGRAETFRGGGPGGGK
jgi:Domain of unknown function (DUF4247)